MAETIDISHPGPLTLGRALHRWLASPPPVTEAQARRCAAAMQRRFAVQLHRRP